MSKFNVKDYKLSYRRDGTSTIDFRDAAGREITVTFRTAALMGLGKTFQAHARNAVVPLTRRASWSSIASVAKKIPPFEDTAGNNPSGLQFGTGVSADLEQVYAWFSPPTEGSDKALFEALLPIADAEKLAGDLQEAVSIARAGMPIKKH